MQKKSIGVSRVADYHALTSTCSRPQKAPLVPRNTVIDEDENEPAPLEKAEDKFYYLP